MRRPPNEAKLLTRALPATRVCEAASVTSNSSDPMFSEARLSVSGVHVGLAAVAFAVRQIPPPTPAT